MIAVDGSHVDVDRHAAARCFLINIGYVTLRYGEVPHAELRSEPLLCADDESLTLRDQHGVREANIEGTLLGMHRAVMEVEALADAVEAAPEGLPVLGLLDGTLVLWGLTGGMDFVREELGGPPPDACDGPAARGVAAADARYREPHQPSAQRGGAERDTHLARGVPARDRELRRPTCGQLRRGERNCDVVGGVTDAALFARELERGSVPRSSTARRASLPSTMATTRCASST